MLARSSSGVYQVSLQAVELDGARYEALDIHKITAAPTQSISKCHQIIIIIIIMHHHHLQQQQQLYPCHIGLKGYGYRLGGLKLETQQNTLPPSSRLSDNIYKEMSGTSCALGIEVAKMFSRNSRLAHRLFRRWTCFLRHMRPLWASAFSLTWWIIKGSMDTAHCMSATNIYELHY